MRAVHEPHGYVAVVFAPENVALAVELEVVGVGGQMHETPDLARTVFGEPQRAVRPQRYIIGPSAVRGDRECRNPAGGRDAADPVAVYVGEPKRTRLSGRDAPQVAIVP